MNEEQEWEVDITLQVRVKADKRAEAKAKALEQLKKEPFKGMPSYRMDWFQLVPTIFLTPTATDITARKAKDGLSICSHCNCMTKVIDSKCGKCGGKR